MARNNPSQTLTLARVDQIVDLILKGKKYLKAREVPLWPTPKDAWQCGLGDYGVTHEYFVNRWGRELSNVQRNRRVSKLSSALHELREQHRHDNDFVWKIRKGWGATWGFVCAPNEAAARQIGHTMFVTGEVSRFGVFVTEIMAEKLSLGGWDVAATHNLKMISEAREEIRRHEARIEECNKSIARYGGLIDSLTSAVMLAGDLGGESAEAAAG